MRYLFIFLVLFLVGCGHRHGEIIDKRYDPPHKIMVDLSGDGAIYPVSVPGRYFIKIRNDGKTGEVEVSKDFYEAVDIGVWYGTK